MAAAESSLTIVSVLPYLLQGLTIALAAIAILANRRSTAETLKSQERQRLWEKRSSTYERMIGMTHRQDPMRRPGIPEIRESLDRGETVVFLESDFESEEWRDFEAAVEAYSTAEVKLLYKHWRDAVREWTFIVARCIIAGDEGTTVERERISTLLNDAYDTTYAVRQELLEQIRSELRFERRVPSLPKYGERIIDSQGGIVKSANRKGNGTSFGMEFDRPSDRLIPSFVDPVQVDGTGIHVIRMTTSVPDRLLEIIVPPFVQSEAEWLLSSLEGRSYAPGRRLLHPGDPFGRFVAWLWRESPDWVIDVLRSYISTLRGSEVLGNTNDPRDLINDFLDALPRALPQSFSADEQEALISRARSELPSRFEDKGDPS